MCVGGGGGLGVGGSANHFFQPRNTFTFLFLPPFFLFFLLSSPPSSFLSLLSFSLLPSFLLTKKCVIFFSAPDPNLYFLGWGVRRVSINHFFSLKNIYIPFLPPFFLPFLPPFPPFFFPSFLLFCQQKLFFPCP